MIGTESFLRRSDDGDRRGICEKAEPLSEGMSLRNVTD